MDKQTELAQNICKQKKLRLGIILKENGFNDTDYKIFGGVNNYKSVILKLIKIDSKEEFEKVFTGHDIKEVNDNQYMLNLEKIEIMTEEEYRELNQKGFEYKNRKNVQNSLVKYHQTLSILGVLVRAIDDTYTYIYYDESELNLAMNFLGRLNSLKIKKLNSLMVEYTIDSVIKTEHKEPNYRLFVRKHDSIESRLKMINFILKFQFQTDLEAVPKESIGFTQRIVFGEKYQNIFEQAFLLFKNSFGFRVMRGINNERKYLNTLYISLTKITDTFKEGDSSFDSVSKLFTEIKGNPEIQEFLSKEFSNISGNYMEKTETVDFNVDLDSNNIGFQESKKLKTTEDMDNTKYFQNYEDFVSTLKKYLKNLFSELDLDKEDFSISLDRQRKDEGIVRFFIQTINLKNERKEAFGKIRGNLSEEFKQYLTGNSELSLNFKLQNQKIQSDLSIKDDNFEEKRREITKILGKTYIGELGIEQIQYKGPNEKGEFKYYLYIRNGSPSEEEIEALFPEELKPYFSRVTKKGIFLKKSKDDLVTNDQAPKESKSSEEKVEIKPESKTIDPIPKENVQNSNSNTEIDEIEFDEDNYEEIFNNMPQSLRERLLNKYLNEFEFGVLVDTNDPVESITIKLPGGKLMELKPNQYDLKLKILTND